MPYFEEAFLGTVSGRVKTSESDIRVLYIASDALPGGVTIVA